MPATPAYHIYPCGDHAITISFGDVIDHAINQQIIAFFHYLKSQQIFAVKDIIPAYHTVTLVYDLLLLKRNQPQKNVYESMRQYLINAAERFTISVTDAPRQIRIPVCYDQSLAPDLLSIAETNRLDTEAIIKLHTSKTYRVYMIGFQPGFAYMGSIDEKIRVPRKSSPRTAVPAGSVGIAGEQTGIYPFQSPGGWQLIGQTPVSIFDAGKKMPCYLQPGDEVQFYAISFTEFKKEIPA